MVITNRPDYQEKRATAGTIRIWTQRIHRWILLSSSSRFFLIRVVMDRLHITGLKSAYGRHQVLQDVNLTVQQGQIIGIVGANGCGKSTFLQILAGLRTPDDGSIYLDGQQVKGRAGAKPFTALYGLCAAGEQSDTGAECQG